MSDSALNPLSTGQLLLTAAIACRQRNREGLRAVISEIAASCSDSEAAELFKTLQQDFSDDLRTWFEAAIKAIREDYEDRAN